MPRYGRVDTWAHPHRLCERLPRWALLAEGLVFVPPIAALSGRLLHTEAIACLVAVGLLYGRWARVVTLKVLGDTKETMGDGNLKLAVAVGLLQSRRGLCMHCTAGGSGASLGAGIPLARCHPGWLPCGEGLENRWAGVSSALLAVACEGYRTHAT